MVYLVWEKESYCEYGVILITTDLKTAKELVCNSDRYYTVMQLDKLYPLEV